MHFAHLLTMRTHSEIIENFGGYNSLAKVMDENTSTVRSWWLRNSIPSEHWQQISDANIASLEELAAAAAHKKESVS